MKLGRRACLHLYSAETDLYKVLGFCQGMASLELEDL
jgi:hypothetical protein